MAGNLIDNKINSYKQVPTFQAAPVNNPVTIQNPINTTSQSDSYTPTGQPAKAPDNKKTLLTLGTWIGLNKLTDMFNNGCTNDVYDKTIVGRLGNWGDKIAKKGSSNPLIKSIKSGFSTMSASAKNYIDKSPLLSAMFKTPTKPENSMVTGFMETQKAADLSEATKTIEKYIDDVPKSFSDAGATKAEIQALKAKYGTNALGQIKNKTRALQEFQLDKLGKPAGYIDILERHNPNNIDEVIKKIKIRHLGLKTKTYKTVLSKPDKNAKAIIEACRRGGKNAKAFFGNTPIIGIFTKRSTNLSMSYNKLISDTKHTTKLGKFLAKAPKTFMRGLTFGGGKIGTLLVALGLGTAFYNAMNAPKKQKVGTAVAGGVDAVSWIVSMPLAIKMMHSVNGMQYAGLSKFQVSKYRVALKNFNKTVKAGGFADKAAYDAALASVNKLKIPVVPQTGFKKALTKVAKFLSIGLETPQPFKEATSVLKGGSKLSAIGRNLKRILPKLGKNAIGYPLRFAIYAAIFSPIVDKVISSITTGIFGKPYEPEEAEENKDKPEVQQPQGNQTPVVQNPQQSQNNQEVKPLDIDALPEDNLVKQTVNGETITNPIPYMPSENCEIDGLVNTIDSENRTYIPAEVGTQVQSNQSADSAKVAAAIAMADKYEAKALDALNGIY